MKKLLCIALSLIFVFLLSCSSEKETETLTNTDTKTEEKTAETEEKYEKKFDTTGVFAAGYSKKAFTPNRKNRVPLAGYAGSEKRLSYNASDNVCATCIAIQDEKGNIALIYTLDLLSITKGTAFSAKGVISKDTGVPEENITFACTHTHSAPAVGSESAAITLWMKEKFMPALRSAAKEAIADLDKTAVYEGVIKLENTNFVRRYYTSEGKWWSIISGGSGNLTKHESPADNSLQLIKFSREHSSPILMINWGAHPCFNSGATSSIVSADYPHNIRTTMEKEGYLCGFWQAAAGNLNATSKMASEEKYNVWQADKYAKKITDAVLQNIDTLTEAKTGEIRSASGNLTLKIDHSQDDSASKAIEVSNLSNAAKFSEAERLAAKYGFHSIYHASHVHAKSRLGETEDLPFSAIGFGDIAFCMAPYEMFCESGMYIKENSPFKRTFVLEQADGTYSYFPTKTACEHGGYEVDSFKYEKGSSEIAADFIVELLNKIAEKG